MYYVTSYFPGFSPTPTCITSQSNWFFSIRSLDACIPQSLVMNVFHTYILYCQASSSTLMASVTINLLKLSNVYFQARILLWALDKYINLNQTSLFGCLTDTSKSTCLKSNTIYLLSLKSDPHSDCLPSVR